MSQLEVSHRESLLKIRWSEKSRILFDLSSDPILGVRRLSRWGELAEMGLLVSRFRRSGIAITSIIGAMQECGRKLGTEHKYSCLKDLVIAEMSEALGLTYQQVVDIFSDFQKSEFMLLCIVAQRPQLGWAALVGEMRQQGKRLVLAGNPLLSVEAIGMRLWRSRLKPEDFDFVSHWENHRVMEPYEAYFTELLSASGAPAHECLLITASRRKAKIAAQLGVMTSVLGGSLSFWDLHRSLLEQKSVKAEMINHPALKTLKQAECV